MDLHPGSQKVRFCYYLLHLSQVVRLKKRPSLGTILGTGFAKKTKNGGSKKSSKIMSKNTPKWTPKWDHLGVISRPASKQLGIWVLRLHLGPPWLHFGVILGTFSGTFFVILDTGLRIVSVFFRVSTVPLNDSDLCWNTPMVSEDTTFYEYSLQNHFEGYSIDTATFSRNTLVRLQQYSQDILNTF